MDENWAPEQLDALVSALTKLPGHVGMSFRGYDPQTRPIPLGQTLVTRGFTATSADPRIAMENGAVQGLLVIVGRTGRELAAHSARPHEQEVLFLPHTVFRAYEHPQTAGLPFVLVEELDGFASSYTEEVGRAWLHLAAARMQQVDERGEVEISSPGKYVGDVI